MQLNFDDYSQTNRLLRSAVFDLVQQEDFDGAGDLLDDCLDQCGFPQLNFVKSLHFDQSPSELSAMVAGLLNHQNDACNFAAISLELEIHNHAKGEWRCCAYAYPDSQSYVFSQKTKEDLRADVRDANFGWRGGFTGGCNQCSGYHVLSLSGFEAWEDIEQHVSFGDKQDQRRWHVATTVAELMIGLCFHELVSTALQYTAPQSLPVFALGHDDPNTAVGIYWTTT